MSNLLVNSHLAADVYYPEPVDYLPSLPLSNIDDGLYDYNVTLGSSDQTQDLRLDIANGLVWVPGTGYFADCSAQNYTNSTDSTDDDDDDDGDDDSNNVTVASIVAELNDNDSLACTSDEGFAMTNTTDASFWSFDTNGPVSRSASASQLSMAFADYVYLSGYWAIGQMNVTVWNNTVSKKVKGSSTKVHKALAKADDTPTDSTVASDQSKISTGSATISSASASSTVTGSSSVIASSSASATSSTVTAKSSTVVVLNDTKFIFANASDVSTGGLGVGQGGVGTADFNFLSGFVRGGLISSNSYSLALDPSDQMSPRLYLGGITTERFTGNLYNFPFVPVVDESRSIITSNNGSTDTLPVVPISGYGVTSNSTGKSLTFSQSYDDMMNQGWYPKPALLDSRTLYNYIPYSTLIQVAVELNAYYAASMASWLVDCNVAQSGTFDIYIGNTAISVNISSIIYPAADGNDTNLFFMNGHEACVLALLPDYILGYSVLGTPFLKHAYLAVDNDGKQLALAKAAVTSNTGNSTNGTSLYQIASGQIPLAQPNNISSYSDLTLTIPATINVSENLNFTSQVMISNGEVIIASSTSNSSVHSTATTSRSVSASGYTGTAKNCGGNQIDTLGVTALGLTILSMAFAML